MSIQALAECSLSFWHSDSSHVSPRSAKQALTELLIPGEMRSSSHSNDPTAKKPADVVSSINLFDSMEIYPGSKIAHFKKLHEKTGIAYEDMVSPGSVSRCALWREWRSV